MKKKKELPEYIIKLKSQLETSNNLIDYFLLCGVPPSIYKEKYLYDIKSPEYLEILKSKLKPKIISKFPDFDISTNTIDEEILNYVFPNGFEPKYSVNILPPKCFSVILDNNLFSSDNPQKYLTCFQFYEPVLKYKKLQLNIENRKPNIHDNCINEELKRANPVNNKGNNDLMNALYSDNNSNNNKIISKNKTNNDNLPKLKLCDFYIPKCICLVSIHPFIKLFEKILNNIYAYFMSAEKVGQNYPIEKIITNLIIEVPIAPRGLYSIQYILIDDIFTLTNVENNRLQISEVNFRKINRKLGLETIIEGLKHILLGSKVILFGSDLNTICDSILAFLYLLFPFKYPFQVTSFLHKDNYNILESISPFIIGINETYHENFFTDNNITIDCMNIFVIDLDKKHSESLLYEEFPNFPKKLVDNLEKDINILEEKFKRARFQEQGRHSVSTYNTIRTNNANNNKEGNYTIKDFNEHYQYYFFYFFCEILKNYEKYLNLDYFKSNDSDKVTSIDTLFQCKKFIESHSTNDIPFYTKFIEESQLFADFIYKRMIPRNSQEIIDVLLVNESIIFLKNRNRLIGTQKTEFLNSAEYKILGKYVVPKAREANLTEGKILIKKTNDYKKKGQIITSIKYKSNSNDLKSLNNNVDNINSNNNNSTNTTKNTTKNMENNKPKEEIIEEFYFQYFIFPELDFNLYCNNDNINDYYFPPDYSEEIEAVNTQCISKSSLGQNINKNIEMRNYIYLTWLEIWAYTFHYIEKIERQYRFNQMLDMLDKVIHHEMNIFNLMFEVLNEEKEQIMIFKLYQKLLQLKINPNTYIYNIISNILDKDQIKELIDANKSNNNSLLNLKFEINSKIKSNFKERTFLSKSDKLLISSKLKFDSVFPCIKCSKKINLFSLCQNYDNVRNDVEWVTCSCGEYNLPKINVKFGFELFPYYHEKKTKKNLSTCTTNEIVLHSPYNLKMNIFDVANKHYGNKLKLEKFKNEFNPLFWDFIWYCHIHNLDYSIILPYLNKIEELNEIRYIETNKEVMQITFNNKLYKRNENVIYDMRSNNKVYNNDNKNKTVKIIKQYKLLIIHREISFEFIFNEKIKNKKNNGIFIDHLNQIKENEFFRKSIKTVIKRDNKGTIFNKCTRVPTKYKKNTDNNTNKLGDISIENLNLRRNNNDIKPIPKNENNNIKNIDKMIAKMTKK